MLFIVQRYREDLIKTYLPQCDMSLNKQNEVKALSSYDWSSKTIDCLWLPLREEKKYAQGLFPGYSYSACTVYIPKLRRLNIECSEWKPYI